MPAPDCRRAIGIHCHCPLDSCRQHPDNDPGTATHTDHDGDLWRITPTGTHIWSNHQHTWIEARTLLDITHRAHGPEWLTPVRPSTHHQPPRRTQ